MAVAESATDQSWAVTLADNFVRGEAVGCEREMGPQEACLMEDTEAAYVVAVAVAVVAEACRSWVLNHQGAYSMGDTAAALTAAVSVEAGVGCS
jgi:hypothetical protein